MSQTKRGKLGSITAWVVACMAIILTVLVIFNRQYILDQIAAWGFRPSVAIQSLADRSGMDDGGKFYFYASQPVIDDAAEFNRVCMQSEEKTAVLGCYADGRIYIYNVTNKQLDGIQEVTAAHEMLHAAYVRLSEDERTRLNTLLENEYKKLQNDNTLSERLGYYARTEPGERDNELHSIIGTEVASLSPDLETYYKQYFANRGKVVALFNQYNAIFTDLQNKADQLSSQLSNLATTINAEVAAYNADISALNTDIATFNARAKQGDFASEGAFEAERSALVARSDTLSQTRTTINNDIARYNQLRSDLEAIASQSEALNKSIDSTLAPAPSV